jgi:hypothetical protein
MGGALGLDIRGGYIDARPSTDTHEIECCDGMEYSLPADRYIS